jgi:hypothetical protein
MIGQNHKSFKRNSGGFANFLYLTTDLRPLVLALQCVVNKLTEFYEISFARYAAGDHSLL